MALGRLGVGNPAGFDGAGGRAGGGHRCRRSSPRQCSSLVAGGGCSRGGAIRAVRRRPPPPGDHPFYFGRVGTVVGRTVEPRPAGLQGWIARAGAGEYRRGNPRPAVGDLSRKAEGSRGGCGGGRRRFAVDACPRSGAQPARARQGGHPTRADRTRGLPTRPIGSA